MSKQVKRKITGNGPSKNKTLSATKTRPSVFERLGTKATAVSTKEFCHHWAQNGTCPYNKSCKYSITHTLISPSKQRAAKNQNEKRKHGKDGPNKSQDGEEWDWNPAELEDADPDDLEKRRAELQRELELQMKMEKNKKKDKKVKKDSSPSTDSSSTTTDSTSSSEESSSSSSSAEIKRKKVKKSKMKRDSSSSGDEKKPVKKSKKQLLKLSHHEKEKKPTVKSNKTPIKSPTPVKIRKESQTPPPKPKPTVTLKPTTEIKSPRLPRKDEKHRTPSPPKPKDKEKEKEREREKEKEREREKEKEREREKKERERLKEREKEKEKERDKKKERTPKRDARSSKDNRRRDTPDSSHSRDKKSPTARSKTVANGCRRDHKSPERRSSLKRDDRSRQKDRNDAVVVSSSKMRKDRKDSREREREKERERRLAREKEREEALARCQERQRERDRLKKLKEEEERRVAKERSRRDDKSSGDRYAGASSSSRKTHSSERDRERPRDRQRERSPHTIRKTSLDRVDIDKERDYERIYNRSTAERGVGYERENDWPDRRLDDKDYASPYDRRLEDRRYLEIDERYDAPPPPSRDDHLPPIDARDYGDERRSRRDVWELRDDRERGIDHHHHRYERRSPSLKTREWDAADYATEMDWTRRQEWEAARGSWDAATEEEWRIYNATRSLDNWPTAEERRRWPNDWREHRDRSRPRSVTSYTNGVSLHDDRRKEKERETEEPSIPREEKDNREPNDDKNEEKMELKESATESKDVAVKRRSTEPQEICPIESKRPCLPETVSALEDNLSEISDDADEILNRDEEVVAEVHEDKDKAETESSLSSSSAQDQPERRIISPIEAHSAPTSSPPRSPHLKDDCIDEENIDMDFEEISEDELEEELRVKGIGDALGVDWASLVAESRSIVKPINSAKKKWESQNVFLRLGVSVELAGEDYVKAIYGEVDGTEDRSNGGWVATLGSLAEVQVANMEKANLKRSLLMNVGPFRRALSARRDLMIRRHLCNLPISDSFVEAPKRYDPELFKLAADLLKR